MLALLLLVLAAAVTFAAVSIVLEASRSGVETIELLGITLYEPATQENAILALCIIVAVAALIVVAALFLARGRRLNNKMAAIDRRLDDKSRQEASEHARASLLQHRVTELQEAVNDLTEKRDLAYEEMRMARAKTENLRQLIARQRGVLEEATEDEQLPPIEELPRIEEVPMHEEPAAEEQPVELDAPTSIVDLSEVEQMDEGSTEIDESVGDDEQESADDLLARIRQRQASSQRPG